MKKIAEKINRGVSFVHKYIHQEGEAEQIAAIQEQKRKDKEETYKTDIVGRKINGLEVISFEGRVKGKYRYKCKCHCGKEFIATRCNIISGNTKSCGCLKGKRYIPQDKNTQERKPSEVIEYKLKPDELAKYLAKLDKKEVTRVHI